MYLNKELCGNYTGEFKLVDLKGNETIELKISIYRGYALKFISFFRNIKIDLKNACC